MGDDDIVSKYWLGLYRTGSPDIYTPPNDWTWMSGDVLNVTHELEDRNGKWTNVIFQNFIWGKEDEMKIERESHLMSHSYDSVIFQSIVLSI